MQVTFFKNTNSDENMSMKIYASELIRHIRNAPGVVIKEISIKGKRLPIVKDVFSKEIFYPFYARFNEGQINHITDHSYGSLMYFLNPKRTIVTCHDLIPLEYVRQSSWLGKKRFMHNIRGMIKAKNLIAVSQYTKDSILRRFDYKGNIEVIYSGVSGAFKKINIPETLNSVREGLGLKDKYRYLLHVGNSNPNKNIELVLKVLYKIPECCLIKVGSFSKRHNKLINKLNIRDRIICLQGLNADELAKLYNVSDLLFFPSFCEGFGFPVVEAMSCGCPVVCSNTSSLPEAGGDAPLYVNPYSEEEALGAVSRVLADSNLKERMVKAGLLQSSKFKWEKTADNVMRLYRKITQE